jgi:predicted transcriptional regulator
MVAEAVRRDRKRKTRTLVTLFDLGVSHFEGRVIVLARS